jgi:hypothetical protein
MTDELPDGALSPSELEPSDEHIRLLENDRYLVTGGDGEEPSAAADDGSASRRSPPGTTDWTGRRPSLDDVDGAYAVVARAETPAAGDTFRAGTNDTSETFESLLRWYVGLLAGDVSPEEAIAVLLANSGLELDVDVD